MNAPFTWRACVAPVVLTGMLCLAAAPVFADDDALTQAKSLYADASYEAALQALQRVDRSAPVAEVLEYQVLCLLALGRTTEAERAAAELVTNSPMLIPSAEEFPPRFMALVTDTRRKLLPTLTKQIFGTAREEYHGPGSTDAAAKFEQVLALANDPVIRNDSDAKDLRTLAMGFLDLLRARPVAAAAAPAVAARPERAPQLATVIQAVPVRQSLPTWVPRASQAAAVDLHGQLKGQLKMVIGVDGRVTSARIVKPTHPAYDVLVLQAARDWLYEPATLNGVPVQSERVLDIVLDVR